MFYLSDEGCPEETNWWREVNGEDWFPMMFGNDPVNFVLEMFNRPSLNLLIPRKNFYNSKKIEVKKFYWFPITIVIFELIIPMSSIIINRLQFQQGWGTSHDSSFRLNSQRSE
jgi:hypothetical protein